MASTSAARAEATLDRGGVSAPERLRLFPPHLVALFAGAIVIVLVLAYPYRGLQTRLGSDAQSDALTIAYLNNWLRVEPGAIEMRLALVRQYLRNGDLARARATFDEAAPGLKARADATDLDLELATRELAAFAKGSPAWVTARARVLDRLAALDRGALDNTRRIALLHRALDLGDAALAQRQVEQLMHGEPLDAGTLMDLSAAMQGIGEYRIASQLAFAASHHARDRATQVRDYIAGIDALRAAGRASDAVDAAVAELGGLDDDRDALIALVRVAREANRLDVAERYARQLMRMSRAQPDDRGAPWWAALERRLGWSLGAPAYARAVEPPTASTPDRPTASAPTSAPTSAPDARPAAPLPGRAFDDEAYTLAYDVFVARARLDEAQRVAEAAVRARPDLTAWHARLAQVAQWNGQPALAVSQWWAVARATGDAAAWQRVRELAPVAHDGDAWIAAVEVAYRAHPSVDTLDEIVRADEALGRPDDAIAVVEAALARAGDDAMRKHALDTLAALGERAQRPAVAERALRALLARTDSTPQHAMRLAQLALEQGQLDAGLTALDAAIAHPRFAEQPIDARASAHRLRADIAARLQRWQTLDADVRALAALDRLDSNDLIAWADVLERDDTPRAQRAALDVLIYAARDTHDAGVATRAFATAVALRDDAGAARVLAHLDAATLARLADDPGFLTQRAQWLLTRGNAHAALRDAQAAQRRAPFDHDVQANVVWIAIAARDADALRAALGELPDPAHADATLGLAGSAGWLALQSPERALAYATPHARAQRDAIAWQLAWADALEGTGQTDLAWRVRARLWRGLLRDTPAVDTSSLDTRERARRLVSLALVFAPGDRARASVQALAEPLERTARAAPPPAAPDDAPPHDGPTLLARVDADLRRRVAPPRSDPDDAQDREVVLSAALASDAPELARAWWVARMRAQTARPVYAELALALAANDHDRLDGLLETVADWMPMRDRIEALERLDRAAHAREVAWAHLDNAPRDDAAHARFSATWVPGTIDDTAARSVGFGVHDERASPIDVTTLRTDATAPIAATFGDLRARVEVDRVGYRVLDAGQLAHVPAGETLGSLTLTDVARTLTWHVRLGERRALRDLAQLDLGIDDLTWPDLGADWHLSGRVARNDAATDTALLRVAGTRDVAALSIGWTLDPRTRLDASLQTSRYRSQGGAALGTGSTWRFDAQHQLDLDEPDLAVRAYAQRQHVAPSGTADALLLARVPDAGAFGVDAQRFLPRDADEFGLALSTGERFERGYTRALRPFAHLGWTRNTVAGSGADLRIGLACSVLGADTLSISAGHRPATAGNPSAADDIELRYRILF